ncbi:MAG: diacylglycerol/lipid kinase family protein [Chloroflexota bacterium]
MRYQLIANPTAGKGRTLKAVPLIEDVFRAAGLTYRLDYTEAAGHATAIARDAARAGYDRIVSIGGDGTMSEVLNGMADSDAALGIIPTGTGNDLARSLGIPLAIAAAAAVAVDPEVRKIDIGREKGAYFAVLAGLGFAADVIDHTNKHKGLLRGQLAIAASVLATVMQLEPQPLGITIDGVSHDGPTVAVFIMNTRYCGGGMMIAPDAREDDGWLDIALLRDLGRADLLRTLPKVYSGRHVGHPKIEFHRGRSVRVTCERPLVKMVDGNVYGQTPLEAEVVPQALSVLTPRRPGDQRTL